jgi:hypothetical protein
MIAGSASAQVREGALELSLDTELFAYQSLLIEEGDYEDETTSIGFGPGAMQLGGTLPSLVSFGIGYVVHPHVIPELALSFGWGKSKETFKDGSGFEDDESDDGPKVGVIMLQPRVEIPFNPGSKFVLSALAGLDYRRFKTKQDEDSVTLNGFGPVLGLVAHMFVTDTVSIDLSPVFQMDFLKSKTEYADGEDDGGDEDPDTFRQTTFGILIGLSAWPGL